MKIKSLLITLVFAFPLLSLAQVGPGDAIAVNSSYAMVPHSTTLNSDSALTIEAWIKPTSFAANSWANVIVSKDGWQVGEQGYTLRCGGNGVLSFNLGMQGSTWAEATSPSGALQLNTWQHVAGTFDGSVMRVYVNGVEVGSNNNNGLIFNGTYGLHIGRIAYTAGGSRYFAGEIDEVRLWRTAVSMTTLRDYACQKLTNAHPDYAQLMANYRFDGATATTFSDLSPNANNGSLFGATVIPSGAAIGDESMHAYAAPYFVSLSAPAGEVLSVGSVNGNPTGVHLYRVDGAPSPLNLPAGFTSIDTSKHWGIFLVGGSNPTADIAYGYNTSNYLFNSNECFAQLAQRPDASTATWSALSALHDLASNSFLPSAVGRIEFVAGLDTLPYPASANSSTTICQGDSATLSVPSGLGFSYQWQLNGSPLPGDTSDVLSATAPGSYNAVITNGPCVYTTNAISISVNPNPNVSITIPQSLCITAGQDTLAGMPAGGVFSGPSVMGNVFDPLFAGLGSHLISYAYTDSNGCVGTATDSLVVHPNPTVFFPSPNTYCLNDPPITLTMALPAGGTYIGPGIAANFYDPVAAGVGTQTVYYTFTDSNSCSAEDSASFIVHPIPPTPVVTQSGNVLISSSPTGNQWYNLSGPIQGATDSTLVAPGDGSYYVIVTDTNGCSVASTGLFIFVGLQESLPLQMTVSPNPSNGQVRLVIQTDLLGMADLRIRDLQGKAVFAENGIELGNQPVLDLDLEDLPKGMYFLEMRMGKAVAVRKLLLQ